MRPQNLAFVARMLAITLSFGGGLAFAVFAYTSQKPGNTEIAVVGSFTNLRFTDEHAYGCSVELWRHEQTLVGILLVSEGLQGDTPSGLLEKVSFNQRTRALSFEAKLSTGVVYSEEHEGVPSRDLFRFSGVLKKNQLRGRLERYDILDPRAKPATEAVILRREQPSSDMVDYKSYSEWKAAIDEILNLRGPKW